MTAFEKTTNAEYEKIVQKLRSVRWRSAARLPGWGGGAGGRKEVTGALAYQRIKRFPERWGGASSKLGLHEKKRFEFLTFIGIPHVFIPKTP